MTKRKRIKKKDLDQAFSHLIRMRDKKCQACPKETDLQCAHIVSRRYMGVRWDADNAVALCRGCHLKFTVRPLEWDEWVEARIGEEAYRALKLRALAVAKVNYEEVALRLGVRGGVSR